MHFLNFSVQYGRDFGLDQGLLTLNHLEDGFLQVWKATSTTDGKQKKGETFGDTVGDRFKWGGLLPANKDTKTKKYSVVLQPVYLSSNTGVACNFYPIKPHVIKTINGEYRSDIGIHLDANHPGLLGCIVMDKFNFDEFEQYMANLRSRGIKEIPLFVQYT